MFGPVHAVVGEPLVERLHPHRPHPLGDQFADRVVDHRRGDAGLQAEAVRQVGRDVELAAADVDLARGRLAERDDSRIQPMDQRRPGRGSPTRLCPTRSNRCSSVVLCWKKNRGKNSLTKGREGVKQSPRRVTTPRRGARHARRGSPDARGRARSRGCAGFPTPPKPPTAGLPSGAEPGDLRSSRCGVGRPAHNAAGAGSGDPRTTEGGRQAVCRRGSPRYSCTNPGRAKREARNSKYEIRNTKQIQNPKFKSQNGIRGGILRGLASGVSDFQVEAVAELARVPGVAAKP